MPEPTQPERERPRLRLLAEYRVADVGDVKGAAAAYRAFIVLWEDCDPELKPMVEMARRKLEGLAAGAQGPPSK